MIGRLQLRELQDLIGVEVLEHLERVIPFVPNSGIDHPNDIYEKKSLERIFFAFSGQDALSERDFRKLLLSRLNQQELSRLASDLGMDPEANFRGLVERISALPWSDNAHSAIIADNLRIPRAFVPVAPEAPPDRETVRNPDNPFKSLKDFQVSVFNNAKGRLQYPLQKMLIQMPTGSGKTRTAMEIICTFLNENQGRSVIWLANSEELCEQAIESFREVWSHIGLFKIDLIRAFGPHGLAIPERASFIVGGFAKVHSAFKRDKELPGELSARIGMIIVDEAHQVVAPTYHNVVRQLLLKNHQVHLIGLTATPGRSDPSGEETGELIHFFSGNRIEIASGEESTIQFLKKRKVLAQVEREPLITNIRYELTAGEKSYIAAHFDFPKSFLDRVSANDLRNIEILKRLRSECTRNKKILFFAGSVEQSKFICALLTFLGYQAEHVDGATRKDRRRNLIERFKYGDLNVICNYGVLTTGFDAPQTDVVFIARPTLSIVLYSQMIGRGLRGPAIGGKEKCTLIEVIDDMGDLGRVDDLFDYFNSYWDSYE